MKVKLLSAGLYGGTINREPGDVLELPDDLARDVAARGDGLLVLPKVLQLVPAFGELNLPTIYEDEPEPAGEAGPAPEAEAEKPAEAPAVAAEVKSAESKPVVKPVASAK